MDNPIIGVSIMFTAVFTLSMLITVSLIYGLLQSIAQTLQSIERTLQTPPQGDPHAHDAP